jgi:hypothetical protein
MKDGGVDATVIDGCKLQLGQMEDFLLILTYKIMIVHIPQIKFQTMRYAASNWIFLTGELQKSSADR